MDSDAATATEPDDAQLLTELADVLEGARSRLLNLLAFVSAEQGDGVVVPEQLTPHTAAEAAEHAC